MAEKDPRSKGRSAIPSSNTSERASGPAGLVRHRLQINGTVQGVGFRPLVYRLARDLGLVGWVRNGTEGVVLEIEGPERQLQRFRERLHEELPSIASIDSYRHEEIGIVGDAEFSILSSLDGGAATVHVSADVATCSDCLQELMDPGDRRHRYPFINCTQCGPRYTITRRLPYDRPFTTMRPFVMCSSCRSEYDDPATRRFHAQPNACARCGPCYWIEPAPRPGVSADIVRVAADCLLDRKILAIKGIGGFHLACLADDNQIVARLRRRKHRDRKPFAVMVPSLTEAKSLAHVSASAEEWLRDPTAPIVLMPKRTPERLAASVAPDSGDYGLMLPYMPLHHLLMMSIQRPLVMTSGNLSDETIVIDNDEARDRLGEVADYIVLHDREIYLGCDDSVVRSGEENGQLLRRSRGLAPRPIRVSRELPVTLALGGILKATVALSRGNEVVVSQHLGDLDHVSNVEALHRTVEHLLNLWNVRPEIVTYDLHPESLGFRVREDFDCPNVGVQHHHAHVASVLAEHQMEGPALGVALDGTGFGTDGTVWGGEFLAADAVDFQRLAHVPVFRLPGGDGAIRHPWRTATGLLWDWLGPEVAGKWARDHAPSAEAAEFVLSMLETDVGCVRTSSLGRVYDAAAAMLGLTLTCDYESEAAMRLEGCAGLPGAVLDLPDADQNVRDYMTAVLARLIEPTEFRSQKLGARWTQAALARWVSSVAVGLCRRHGLGQIAASGGCLVNRWLRTELRQATTDADLGLFFNRDVPAGDGGLALGQVWVAAHRRLAREGNS